MRLTFSISVLSHSNKLLSKLKPEEQGNRKKWKSDMKCELSDKFISHSDYIRLASVI